VLDGDNNIIFPLASISRKDPCQFVIRNKTMLPPQAASRAIVGPCSRTSCSSATRRWFASRSRRRERHDFQAFLSKGLPVSNDLPKAAVAAAGGGGSGSGGFVSKLPKFLYDHTTLEMDAEITRLMTLTEEPMQKRTSSNSTSSTRTTSSSPSSSSSSSSLTVPVFTPVPLHPLAQQILCYLQTHCHDWIIERQLEQLTVQIKDGSFQLDFPDGQARIWTTLTRPPFVEDNDEISSSSNNNSRDNTTPTITTTTTTSWKKHYYHRDDNNNANNQKNLFLCLASEKTSVQHAFLLQADRFNEKQLQETVRIIMRTVEEEGW